MNMFDRDGVRLLNDDELHSDSADRLQDIQRRLAQISKRLVWVAVPLWVLAILAIAHLKLPT